MKHIDDVSREVEMNTLKSIGFELVHDATGQGPLWKNTLAAELQARLSRYETAIREALRLLGAPMFPSVGGNDVRDILRATLSDQPAVNSMAFTRGDGDRALDCLIKNMRTTPADQPAEEPAESKLEAVKTIFENFEICGQMQATDENVMRVVLSIPEDSWMKLLAILDAQPAESKLEAIRRLAATLNLNPDLHSAALTDVGKEKRKISEALLAILDAQPSTPSGEERRGEEMRQEVWNMMLAAEKQRDEAFRQRDVALVRAEAAEAKCERVWDIARRKRDAAEILLAVRGLPPIPALRNTAEATQMQLIANEIETALDLKPQKPSTPEPKA